MAVGPGIMMLIVGVIVGASGFFYSISEMILDYHLKLSLAGFVIFVTSLVATFLVFFKHDADHVWRYFCVHFYSYPKLFGSLSGEEVCD